MVQTMSLGKPRSAYDMIVASTAMAEGCVLLTTVTGSSRLIPLQPAHFTELACGTRGAGGESVVKVGTNGLWMGRMSFDLAWCSPAPPTMPNNKPISRSDSGRSVWLR
jgi:hypothetical protein